MARLPRVVIPGIPHHVTQRGNGRARTFFEQGDFAASLRANFDEDEGYAALRKAERVGRPIGSPDWLSAMEERTGKVLAARRRGPVGKGTRNTASPVVSPVVP